MIKHCKYCANYTTQLDIFGFCKKYNCFNRSGKNVKYESFKNKISNLILIPNETRQISGQVSNFYNIRNRKANDIMYEIEKEFGFIPSELYYNIPEEYRKKWDSNIRW